MVAFNKKNEQKIIDRITDKYGAFANYKPYINNNLKAKKLTEADKYNLINFLDKNLSILNEQSALKEIDAHDQNIETSLDVPQLPTTPITSAKLTYTYIVTKATPSAPGIAAHFSSKIYRDTEESPWKSARVLMRYNDSTKILTDFNLAEYKKLHLKFVEKFFLSDIISRNKSLDFSSFNSTDKFYSSNFNWLNYVFYRFITVKNSVPLTVVFGVTKDQYNASETYPRNWFYAYMKRGD